jgi:galactonate dehydratase
MKVSDCTTFVVGNPPPGAGGRYFIFVKLVTDGGVVGYGESYNATFGPHQTALLIHDVADRHLIGHDPHDIERFFRSAYSSGFTQRPDVTLMGCVSALEMACWDIIGKEAGVPVYKLFGGVVNDRLRAYTYLYPTTGSVVPAEIEGTRNVYNDPDIAAETASQYVDQGFTAIKFDPAGPYTIYDGHQPRQVDIGRSVAMMSAVRGAVGKRADILFGTHGQFSASGAKRMATSIEQFDPLWFEEPVPPDMPEVMADVALATSIPIAAGERLTTKWEFARVLALRAAAILQPNVGRCGGLLEAKKISAMAEAHHVQVAPHCYCGPIVAAANIQLAVTLPNFLILEAIKKFDGFHATLLTKPLRVEDGYVIPSSEPGLGVELNEEVCNTHRWTGPELHLEMDSRPIDTPQ